MVNDQEKREKVIKGLEHELRNRGKCGHYCREGIETFLCEYDKDGFCIQHWGKDALALLKAQEPVKPISCKSYIHTEPITFDYECPICMTGIMRNWVACPICGQAVKWK